MNVKSKYLVLFVLILSAGLVGFIVLKTDVTKNNRNYSISIYQVAEGYGYSVSYGSKLLIKQDYIPAIQENHPFCDFDDAYKVADFVRDKLTANKLPNVSLQELMYLKVKLNCSI